MNVATEIFNQLGGNRFAAMTGSKNFTADENTLRMTLSRNKVGAKWLKITLNAMDTYDLQFIANKKTLNKEWAAAGVKIYHEEPVIVKEYHNVYCDMLQDIFTTVTGLYTSL